MSERHELQELRGIGPVVEQRLRDAGITAVEQLATADPAEVGAALAGLRGMTAERIAGWIDEASHLTGGATTAPTGPAGGERRETFVLTLAIDADGDVVRSGMRHVRTDHQRSWAGWRHDELDRFVAERAGLAAADATAEPLAPLPAITLHHDLGLVVGGHRSAIRATVDTAALEERAVADFAYRAVLSSRGIGGGEPRPLTWHAGTAEASGPLDLRFPETELAPGVHRMLVAVEVTPLVRSTSEA